MADLNSTINFSKDWNGFYQVSNTSSAYSSLDLQADNKIGFIYEETLTGFGKRPNPVSTSFPTGSGEHNFDGFDNIYLAMDLELITNKAYSIKRDVNRRTFLQEYFTQVVAESALSEAQKAEAGAMIEAFNEEPTLEQIDAIYALLASVKPADPWDGKTITFTNVQQNGKEYVLYISANKTLELSTKSAEELGEKAQFLCKKEPSGKYSFYNKSTDLYMIWRGKGNGYNSDKGTLSTYNATYCDWSINDASASRENTYYIQSKRSNGTTDGTIIVMAAGTFDAWSSGVGYSANYSNLFRLDIVESATGIDSLEDTTLPSAIYDLSGRRVNNPGKGFYIQNGKVVIK